MCAQAQAATSDSALDQAESPKADESRDGGFENDEDDSYPAALVWDQRDDPWPELREQQTGEQKNKDPRQ